MFTQRGDLKLNFYSMKLNNDYLLREIAGEKVIIMQSDKMLDMTKLYHLILPRNIYGNIYKTKSSH